MKRIGLLICTVCAMMLVACGPNREDSVAKITAYEEQLQVLKLDESKADTLIAMYNTFVNDFEKDSLAPVYLMRAAEMLSNVGRPEESLQYLDRIIDSYSDFEDLAGCYFLKGYAFEAAGEYDLAKEAYTYFVETYPDHVLAKDTRAIIPYIGMSPEDLLDVLLEKDSIVAENLSK